MKSEPEEVCLYPFASSLLGGYLGFSILIVSGRYSNKSEEIAFLSLCSLFLSISLVLLFFLSLSYVSSVKEVIFSNYLFVLFTVFSKLFLYILVSFSETMETSFSDICV